MTQKKFGYPIEKWNDAKREALTILMATAADRRDISYSELAAKINAITFDAHDSVFHHMLGDISVEEHKAGRGMLSVLVVHKADRQPGPGFFQLAKSLGLSTKDQIAFGVEELKKVHGHWSDNK